MILSIPDAGVTAMRGVSHQWLLADPRLRNSALGLHAATLAKVANADNEVG